MDKIVIIIPVYYSEDYLNRCLNSIYKQDKVDKNIIQVIIINNNSPHLEDNYQKIISFYSCFLNINYMRLSQNFGPGIARQKGLEIVPLDTKYIIFLDDDDCLGSSLALYSFLQKAKENPHFGFIFGKKNNLGIDGSNFITQTGLTGSFINYRMIIDYNLSFSDLFFEEDTLFLEEYNIITERLGQENKCPYIDLYIDLITYIKNDNKNSLCNLRFNDYQKIKKDFLRYQLRLANILLKQPNDSIGQSIILRYFNNLFLYIVFLADDFKKTKVIFQIIKKYNIKNYSFNFNNIIPMFQAEIKNKYNINSFNDYIQRMEKLEL